MLNGERFNYASGFFSQMLASTAAWVNAGRHHPGLHWGVNVQSRLLSCSNPPVASPPLRASPWNLVGPLSCALDPPPLPFFLLVNLLTQPHTLLCLDQVLDGIRNLYVPSHLQFSWLFTDPLMSPSNLNHNFISSRIRSPSCLCFLCGIYHQLACIYLA